MDKSGNQSEQQAGLKCLYFVDRMRHGGIQTFLLELAKHMDHSRMETDFLLLDDGTTYPLEKELEKYGNVYKLDGVWVKRSLDFVWYRKAVDAFFTSHHQYHVIHMNSGPKNYYILKAAGKYQIPVRIAHSHNTGYQTKSPAKQWLGNCMKQGLRRYANVYLACSDLAGEWMFGQNLMVQGKVRILPNGIDLEKFQFDPVMRKKKRRELQADQRLVIGHVGRFTMQKNHLFLIDIFRKIAAERPDALLLLVGVGELQGETENRVRQSGLEKQVRFLGYRSDVTELMHAMDVFVMPSLYEGFPVTAVEAQALGLPCVFSDTITANVKLLKDTMSVSLKESPGLWAQQILAVSRGAPDRTAANQMLRDRGYDIRDMVQKLVEIYQNQMDVSKREG